MRTVKTNGKETTEWWLMKVVGTLLALYVMFLTIATNLWGWTIPAEINQSLFLLVGATSVYTGGRSYFKAALAKSAENDTTGNKKTK